MEHIDPKFERDKFLLHQKHFTIGEKYYIYDEKEQPLFYVEREKFKLHAHIHVYNDDSKSRELLTIKDKSIFDVNAGMDVKDPATGELIGSFKRDVVSSMLRRTWKIMDRNGNEIGHAMEDSIGKALIRRFLPFGALLKTDFIIEINNKEVGRFIRKWTISDKYILDLSSDPSRLFDRRLAVALGILLDSAEAR
ncbi:MAG TPA: hypothetical protein ENF58_00540 [Candidatus Altiarchaeales archaeon]|nr:hypothetical protein [Candidatus Altiarchaeales archaeon]